MSLAAALVLARSYPAPVTGGAYGFDVPYGGEQDIAVEFLDASGAVTDTLAPVSQFTLDPPGLSYDGGTVTILRAVPSTVATLRVRRTTRRIQPEIAPPDAVALEIAADRAMMALQEDFAAWAQTVRVPELGYLPPLPLAAQRAGKFVQFDSVGAMIASNAPFISVGAAEFDSRLNVQSASVPAPATFLRTAGYDAPGDGGGGLYKRVATEPAHAFKVRDASGAWFELVPEAGQVSLRAGGAKGIQTDDTAVIQGLMTWLADQGGGTILGDRGDFGITSAILDGTGINGYYGFVKIQGTVKRGHRANGNADGFALIMLDGTKNALTFRNTRQCEVKDVIIRPITGLAMTTGHAIVSEGGNNISIDAVNIDGTHNAILINGTSRFQIRRVDALGQTGPYCLRLAGTFTAPSGGTALISFGEVSGCFFQPDDPDGVGSATTDSVQIGDGVFSVRFADNAFNRSRYGVVYGDATNVNPPGLHRFDNCSCENNRINGVWLRAGSQMWWEDGYVSIINNDGVTIGPDFTVFAKFTNTRFSANGGHAIALRSACQLLLSGNSINQSSSPQNGRADFAGPVPGGVYAFEVTYPVASDITVQWLNAAGASLGTLTPGSDFTLSPATSEMGGALTLIATPPTGTATLRVRRTGDTRDGVFCDAPIINLVATGNHIGGTITGTDAANSIRHGIHLTAAVTGGQVVITGNAFQGAWNVDSGGVGQPFLNLSSLGPGQLVYSGNVGEGAARRQDILAGLHLGAVSPAGVTGQAPGIGPHGLGPTGNLNLWSGGGWADAGRIQAQAPIRLMVPSGVQPIITGGVGSPEGVVTAPVGSIYLNNAGGTGTTLFVKRTGTGATGWFGAA